MTTKRQKIDGDGLEYKDNVIVFIVSDNHRYPQINNICLVSKDEYEYLIDRKPTMTFEVRGFEWEVEWKCSHCLGHSAYRGSIEDPIKISQFLDMLGFDTSSFIEKFLECNMDYRAWCFENKRPDPEGGNFRDPEFRSWCNECDLPDPYS